MLSLRFKNLISENYFVEILDPSSIKIEHVHK